jgi:hypothetical protein
MRIREFEIQARQGGLAGDPMNCISAEWIASGFPSLAFAMTGGETVSRIRITTQARTWKKAGGWPFRRLIAWA